MLEYGRDPIKEAENVRRHGVDFKDGIIAIRDPFAIRWFDEAHSTAEPRFVTIGRDLRGRLLTVVTSEDWPRPRIISARRATKRERHAYEHKRPLGPF